MNRKITAALAALAVTVTGGAAFATQTRTNSLGGGEKEFTVRDEANVGHLPQLLVDHGNKVFTDASVGGSYGTMHINYKLSDTSVIQLYGASGLKNSFGIPGKAALSGKGTGTLTGVSVQDTGVGYSPAGLADPTNHELGIGFATKFGAAARFGGNLNFYGNTKQGDDNNKNNNSFYRLGLGIGFDLSEKNSLDFGLGVGFGFIQQMDGTDEKYNHDGTLTFDLLGKGEFEVHTIAKIVPFLAIGYRNWGVKNIKSGEGTDKGSVSRISVALGSDLAITPSEGILIQPGVGLMYLTSSATGPDSTKVEDSNAIIFPYYGFAAEGKVFDWLVLRLGAKQIVSKISTNKTDKQTQAQQSMVDYILTTGFGIKAGSWTIDLNVNPLWFNNGPYLISGAGTGTPAVAADKNAGTPAVPATFFATDVAIKLAW